MPFRSGRRSDATPVYAEGAGSSSGSTA
jgi:hypothetical protein